MAEQIELDGYEYRVQGGEVHRRPIDKELLLPWQASWEVVAREDRPNAVVQHFFQATTKNLTFDH